MLIPIRAKLFAERFVGMVSEGRTARGPPQGPLQPWQRLNPFNPLGAFFCHSLRISPKPPMVYIHIKGPVFRATEDVR
jgi:hypothetical protein